MKTLADVKRRLQIGVTVTLIWAKEGMGHKNLGIARRVQKVQSNAVVFESPTSPAGCWLTWRKAKDVIANGDKFSIYENGEEILRYEVQP